MSIHEHSRTPDVYRDAWRLRFSVYGTWQVGYECGIAVRQNFKFQCSSIILLILKILYYPKP